MDGEMNKIFIGKKKREKTNLREMSEREADADDDYKEEEKEEKKE